MSDFVSATYLGVCMCAYSIIIVDIIFIIFIYLCIYLSTIYLFFYSFIYFQGAGYCSAAAVRSEIRRRPSYLAGCRQAGGWLRSGVMALSLLWGPQGQRAGLGTRGLGLDIHWISVAYAMDGGLPWL